MRTPGFTAVPRRATVTLWPLHPAAPARPSFGAVTVKGGAAASLFGHFGWLFDGFLRERVFQDDADRIAASLWPAARSWAGATSR